MPRRIASLIGAFLVSLRLGAQHTHPATDSTVHHGGMDMQPAMAGALGIAHTRLGSGTSWQPEASPHYVWHWMRGDWNVMAHGIAFVQYDHQGGPRGDDQFNSVNWGMIMAMHPLAGGMVHLHGMMSAEPFTVGAHGYPLLLQSGESYHGEPLHDRQHQHDLWMELAAMYEHPVGKDVALSVYAAPAGDPALGPVAFPHRMSAAADPFAPLGHHWQDATHITFGVITAGVFGRRWKLEGSIFNGREPDENRYNIEFRKLDSYSARAYYNPTERWSVSGWYGYLPSSEELHPDESLHRYGASVLYTRPWQEAGQLSGALIYGANKSSESSRASNSALAEGTADLDGRNSLFGRVEWVEKSAADLALDQFPSTQLFDVGELTLGYLRELIHWDGIGLGAAVTGTLNFVPSSLSGTYGSRTPVGLSVSVRLRPARRPMQGMAGHEM